MFRIPVPFPFSEFSPVWLKSHFSLIFKPRFLPDRIPHPAQIPPFESPPNPFMKGKRRDPRPLKLLRQKLMWWDPIFFFLVFSVDFSPKTFSAILPKDLRPVGDTDRQRRRHINDRAIVRTGRSFRRFLRDSPCRFFGLVSLFHRWGSGIPDLRFVEFEGMGVWDYWGFFCGKEAVGGAGEMGFLCHGKWNSWKVVCEGESRGDL